MPVVKQRPQVSLPRSRYPDARERGLAEQFQQACRVARIGLLLAHRASADRRRMAHHQFVPEFFEHLHEPQAVPGAFDPHQSRFGQRRVKAAGLPAPVLQAALPVFSRFRVHHRDLLKARMKITAFNQHLSAPPLGRIGFALQHQSNPGLGADDVMRSE